MIVSPEKQAPRDSLPARLVADGRFIASQFGLGDPAILFQRDGVRVAELMYEAAREIQRLREGKRALRRTVRAK